MSHPPKAPIAPSLPRFSAEELEEPDNIEYKERIKPYILTGAADDWPAMDKWLLNNETAGESYLGNLFSRAVSDFYPYNMLKSGTHPYLIRFKSGLNEILKPPGRFRDYQNEQFGCGLWCRYLHLQLTPSMWKKLEDKGDLPKKRHSHMRGDEWWMRRCMKDPVVREEFHLKTHWKIILIGSLGAGMFNHTDSLLTSSWHTHVQGIKWWYICKDGECFESVVHPGETVYYNYGWWHETRNMETPTMTVTGTSVHRHNYQVVADRLHSECAYSAMQFGFSSALCDALDKCYLVWHKILEGKPAPKGRWKPWKKAATRKQVRKLRAIDPASNNYDGSNHITD